MSTEEYNENEEFETRDDSYEPDYEEEEEKPRKGSRIVLIIAVCALVGLNGFLGYNIYNQTEKLKVKEKELAELDSQRVLLLAKVDSLSSSLISLNKEVNTKDSSLQALISQLQSLKEELNGKDQQIKSLYVYKQKYNDYMKYKNEAEEKEKEIEGIKKALAEEKERARAAQTANDTLAQKLKDLEQDKANLVNKVNLGSRLTGSIKEVTTLSEKRGKTKTTDKASQVSKVQIKYTIAANNIATKETKTAYIIIKSGSKTFTEPGFTFPIGGNKTLEYTHKDEVKYNGQETSSSPTLNLPADLASGKYTVEIYIDEKLLDSGSFNLR